MGLLWPSWLRCRRRLRGLRRRLRRLLWLPLLTAALLTVVILAIGLLRLLNLRLNLRCRLRILRHLLLTSPPLPIILAIVWRLRDYRGLLRRLLHWWSRLLRLAALLAATVLPVILRRLWNYSWLLLQGWPHVLRPAALLAATLLPIVLLPVHRRLRNHCGLRRLLHLRRSLGLRSELLAFLLPTVLLATFSLRTHLTDLRTPA